MRTAERLTATFFDTVAPVHFDELVGNPHSNMLLLVAADNRPRTITELDNNIRDLVKGSDSGKPYKDNRNTTLDCRRLERLGLLSGTDEPRTLERSYSIEQSDQTSALAATLLDWQLHTPQFPLHSTFSSQMPGLKSLTPSDCLSLYEDLWHYGPTGAPVEELAKSAQSSTPRLWTHLDNLARKDIVTTPRPPSIFGNTVPATEHYRFTPRAMRAIGDVLLRCYLLSSSKVFAATAIHHGSRILGSPSDILHLLQQARTNRPNPAFRTTIDSLTPHPWKWRSWSACRDTDTEVFFPVNPNSSAEQPKAICRQCPVQSSCLHWALETGQREGVMGGMTPAERAQYNQILTRARRLLGRQPDNASSEPTNAGISNALDRLTLARRQSATIPAATRNTRDIDVADLTDFC